MNLINITSRGSGLLIFHLRKLITKMFGIEPVESSEFNILYKLHFCKKKMLTKFEEYLF